MPNISFIGYTLSELLEKPTIEDNFLNKQVWIFIHQTKLGESLRLDFNHDI